MHSPQSRKEHKVHKIIFLWELRTFVSLWLRAALIALVAVGLQAGEIRLGLEPDLWQKRISNTGGVAEAAAPATSTFRLSLFSERNACHGDL